MTTILTCPDETELLALAMGEPVPAEVTAHLEGCAMCRVSLDRFQAEVATLRQNHGQETTLPSTELDPAVDHAVGESDAGTTSAWTPGPDRLGPAAVAAARAVAEGQGALPDAIGKYKDWVRIGSTAAARPTSTGSCTSTWATTWCSS